MNELNKKTLTGALQKMPQYSVGSEVWDRIDARLEIQFSDMSLQTGLRSLQEYSPPHHVWPVLLQKMQTAKRALPYPRLALRQVWKYAAAAAVLLMGILIVPGLFRQPEAKVSTSVSEENSFWSFGAGEDLSDETAIEEIWKEFQNKRHLIQNVELEAVDREMMELNTARQELLKAIQTLGTDPHLIKQLKQIELDRSQIIKKIAVAI